MDDSPEYSEREWQRITAERDRYKNALSEIQVHIEIALGQQGARRYAVWNIANRALHGDKSHER